MKLEDATPRPWFLFQAMPCACVGGPCDHPDFPTALVASCGAVRRSPTENQANAELILRAVNCFEELVAACKLMRDRITDMSNENCYRWNDWHGSYDVDRLIDKATAE